MCSINGSINNNGTLHPDYFLYSFGSELPFLKNGIGYLRLVKLHGSTTWLKRADTKEIEEKNFDIDQGFYTLGTGKMYDDEVVIYPLRQKQLYIDPYIQMFYCLNKELESKKVWIVIGYSFRDPVIQNIFNINFKDGKKMILISPHPDEVKERFSDHREVLLAANLATTDVSNAVCRFILLQKMSKPLAANQRKILSPGSIRH